MDGAPQLRGKRALVTGGTKRIGHAAASRLRDLGAVVLVTARTIPNDLEAVSLLTLGALRMRTARSAPPRRELLTLSE